MKENKTVEKQEEPEIKEKRNQNIRSRRRRRRKQNKGQSGTEMKLQKKEALNNRKRSSHSKYFLNHLNSE